MIEQERLSLQEKFLQACEKGNIEEVQLLLANPIIDPNCEKEGWTGLHNACYNGQTEIVKLLLNDNRVDIKRNKNKRKKSAFYVACEEGNIDIVKLFANDPRIDLNDQSNRAFSTPLICSCRSQRYEVMKYLLVIGGKDLKINVRDCHNKSAINHLRDHKRIDLIELLEEFQKNPTEIQFKLKKELGILEEEETNNSNPKTYILEYNNLSYKLKTTTQNFNDLENAIKSKIGLEKNQKIQLHYHQNGNLFILVDTDDMKDLEEGIKIQVSNSQSEIHSQQQIQTSSSDQITFEEINNWNDIVSLSQSSNSEYQIEIDPDEIPSNIKTEIVNLMEMSSKLETCLKFRTSRSNIIFQLSFQTSTRATKVYDQIVDLLDY